MLATLALALHTDRTIAALAASALLSLAACGGQPDTSSVLTPQPSRRLGGPLHSGENGSYCLHRVQTETPTGNRSLDEAYRLLHTAY